jgi:hypothetical protein
MNIEKQKRFLEKKNKGKEFVTKDGNKFKI